jgi:LacI family transcriptional regulator
MDFKPNHSIPFTARPWPGRQIDWHFSHSKLTSTSSTMTSKSTGTKAPAMRKRYRVGVRLLDWSQGFCYRLFPGILEIARSGNDLELVFEQPSGGDIAPVIIDENWDGDGLLVYRYTAAEASAWSKKAISVVNLSTEHPSKARIFPRVTLDNEEAGVMAAQHLMTLGLRRFAYWHDPHRRYSCERLEGFSRELRREGHEAQVFEIPASYFSDRERAGKIESQAWKQLAKLEAPTGLFTKDDIAAVCALRALATLGLRCPEDIPVVGVADDMVYCNGTNPALSSIRFPGRMIGNKAMQLLLSMMQGETVADATRVLVKPVQLTVRESSGLVELPDEVVTKAMRFIRANVPERGVSVDELCRAAGVSRELLRQRFQHTLGRTPKEEIDRQRAQIVCNFLRQTTWTIDRIAEDLGFGAADELCRFFKRTMRVTPGGYRRGGNSTRSQ